MKNSIIWIALMVMASVSLSAAEKKSEVAWDGRLHELRIGWGDALFEEAEKYEFPAIGRPNIEPRYLTGHLFCEYQYSWNRWCSTGMQLDYEQMGWHDKRENPRREHNYWNVTILPTVRFTYYRHPWVSLYSGIGIGMTINGGTEKDLVSKKTTVLYPNLNLNLFAVQVGQKGFFGTFELGAMFSLLGGNNIVMAGSRLMSVSVGYRFK